MLDTSKRVSVCSPWSYDCGLCLLYTNINKGNPMSRCNMCLSKNSNMNIIVLILHQWESFRYWARDMWRHNLLCVFSFPGESKHLYLGWQDLLFILGLNRIYTTEMDGMQLFLLFKSYFIFMCSLLYSMICHSSTSAIFSTNSLLIMTRFVNSAVSVINQLISDYLVRHSSWYLFIPFKSH